jgi:hypothetical protein
MARPAVWMVFVAGLLATPAAAQQNGSVGVGASATLVGAPDDAVEGVPRFGPLIRYGESESGWGIRLGFNWYAVDLQIPAGPAPAEFGRLRVRPIMAGYGYTHVFGPVAASANVLAGYAFTSASMRRSFAEGHGDVGHDADIRAGVGNVFVLKPELSSWIDVTAKVGLNVSVGYMLSRPTVTLSSAAGRTEHPVRADVVMFKVGLVYALY